MMLQINIFWEIVRGLKVHKHQRNENAVVPEDRRNIVQDDIK